MRPCQNLRVFLPLKRIWPTVWRRLRNTWQTCIFLLHKMTKKSKASRKGGLCFVDSLEVSNDDVIQCPRSCKLRTRFSSSQRKQFIDAFSKVEWTHRYCGSLFILMLVFLSGSDAFTVLTKLEVLLTSGPDVSGFWFRLERGRTRLKLDSTKEVTGQ